MVKISQMGPAFWSIHHMPSRVPRASWPPSQGVLKSALKGGGIPSTVLQRGKQRGRHLPKVTQLITVRAPVETWGTTPVVLSWWRSFGEDVD